MFGRHLTRFRDFSLDTLQMWKGDCLSAITNPREYSMATKETFRIVTRGCDGSLLIRDYPSCDPISAIHDQVGTDDCSTDLDLRGMPIFRGLIGPMPEGKTIVRYESPEVFEALTKEWGEEKPRRSRNRGRRNSSVA